RRRVLGFLDGISSAMNTAHHQSPPRRTPATVYYSPTSTPSTTRVIPSPSPSNSSSSSIPLTGTQHTPFSLHFDRTRKLIQPLFPMGIDPTSPTSSPENSFVDLSEVEGKRRTGEFE